MNLFSNQNICTLDLQNNAKSTLQNIDNRFTNDSQQIAIDLQQIYNRPTLDLQQISNRVATDLQQLYNRSTQDVP